MFTSKKHVWLTSLLLGIVVTVILITHAQARKSKDAIRIEKKVDVALNKLLRSNKDARNLFKQAVAILVFPDILKAGFGYGAQVGNGVLIDSNGKTAGFYNTFAASYGFQVGLQGFGYALFFMDNDSLSYLDKSKGFELGVGPSIVVVNVGFGKTVSTSTLRKGIYAFIFDQKGLMGGAGIQGTKITKINP